MEYVKVAQIAELSEGQKKKVSINGIDVLLTNISGMYYAIENTCPHMGGSLYDGKLEGNHIICPKHGSIFDVTTGEVVQSGKILFISAKVHALKKFEVIVEGTDLKIEI